MINNRNYFLDYAKGILALLVVLGHIITLRYTYGGYWNNYSTWIIYSFYMPLFIAISGYLTGKDINYLDYKQFIKKKAQRLLYPWFSITAILTILIIIFPSRLYLLYQANNTFDCCYRVLTLFWFMPCVFILNLFLYRINKSKIYFIFFVILWSISIIYYYHYPDYILKQLQIIRNAPIFICAFLVKKYNIISKIKTQTLIFLSILPLLLAIFILLRKGTNLLTYHPLYRIALGFSISYVSLIFMYACYRLSLIKNVFIKLGENSLGIYMIHFIILLFLFPNEFYTDKILSSSWIIIILLTSLFTMGSFYLTQIATKHRFTRKYLLGYKN